ncbi:PorT family protein [Aquimarina sp. D1M17]|uniref:outer membrane beta-barrel protein n=1 Tax=Aquimarina acroporae TaxID=2937283 RepID=UPI0020BE5039|nr:outer membrane beta-barrel protein [Aquimarina acroporae]MCK8523211.1 PorT family protein [Aquimarina acroporae]
MSHKKNIDRLFQEKFKDFEVTPDESVWEKIQAQQKKSKKRVFLIPLWYKVGGAAALVAVIATIGYFLTNNNPTSTTNTTIVNSEKTENTNTTEVPQNTSPSEITPNKIVENDQEKNSINSDKEDIQSVEDHATEIVNTKETYNIPNDKKSLTNTNSPLKASSTNKAKNPSESNTKNAIAIAQDQTKNSPVIATTEPVKSQSTNENKNANGNVIKEKIAQQQSNNNLKEDNATTDPVNDEKKSIFEAIAESKDNEKEEETQSSSTKRWIVSPNIAPVYYNSIGEGSSIDSQFADNEKNGEVNLSYGVQISYAVNDRLSIRSGVNKVDLSYSTQDVGFNPSATGQNLSNIDYSPNGTAILISDFGNSNISDSSSFEVARDVINQRQNIASLNQNIAYIEVPLEMKYAILNKKLGVNMIGGISTLFLQDNEISLEAGDFETELGEGNNLNEISFSGNFGIGIDYKISDQFQLNLEPILKYQFNAFENSDDFRPYYFGVYTGVSIKF